MIVDNFLIKAHLIVQTRVQNKNFDPFTSKAPLFRIKIAFAPPTALEKSKLFVAEKDNLTYTSFRNVHFYGENVLSGDFAPYIFNTGKISA